MTGGEPKKTSSKRSLEILVPIVGLLYSSIILIYFLAVTALRGDVALILFLLPFLIVFLVAAFGVWRHSRIGYIASIVITAIFLLLYGFMATKAFGNPGDTQTFVITITILPALAAALIYSVIGVRLVWRKGVTPTPAPAIPRSSIYALLLIGFILGGLAVGLMAGITQSRLLSSIGTGDVIIVIGASSASNGRFFSPASFQVVVGHNVTWVNRDAADHTVTSTTSAFDSGNIASGSSWSHKFTATGTFNYVCSYHSWMMGTIVVVSS